MDAMKKTAMIKKIVSQAFYMNFSNMLKYHES